MNVNKSKITVGILSVALLAVTYLGAMEIEKDANEWLSSSSAPVNTMASLDNEFENEIFPIVDEGVYEEFLETRNQGVRAYQEFSLVTALQYYSPTARSYRALESNRPGEVEREFKNSYMDHTYQQVAEYCDFVVPFSNMENPKEQFEGYYEKAMNALVDTPTLENEFDVEYQSSVDRTLNSQYGLPASFSFIDSYPLLQDAMESAARDTKNMNKINSYCGVNPNNLSDTQKFIELFLSKSNVEENDDTGENLS